MLAKPSHREVPDKGAWHEVEGSSTSTINNHHSTIINPSLDKTRGMSPGIPGTNGGFE